MANEGIPEQVVTREVLKATAEETEGNKLSGHLLDIAGELEEIAAHVQLVRSES